jgi:hypothetical protein
MKRLLAALSDPARARVLRKRGAAAQAVPVGFCIFCSLGASQKQKMYALAFRGPDSLVQVLGLGFKSRRVCREEV